MFNKNTLLLQIEIIQTFEGVMYRNLIIIIVMTLVLSACHTQEEPLPPRTTENEYTRLFDVIWNKLDSSYVFFDLLPCDWDSLHKAYYYRVESVTTEDAFVNMISEMFDAIGDPYIYLFHQGHIIVSRPEKFRPRDMENWLREQKHDTYEIPARAQFTMMDNGVFRYGSVIRINKSKKDTAWYHAVSLSGLVSDARKVNGITFATKIKKLYSDSRAKGLILDLRGCQQLHLTIAPMILSTFYPLGKSYSLTAQARSPYSSSHLAMIDVDTYSMTGMGCYGNKPIVILVNEAVILEAHTVATILSELPNVMVVGRSSSGGRGGVCAGQIIDSSTYMAKDTIYGPAIRFANATHSNFNAPLQPDRLVDWIPTAEEYEHYTYIYDKCLDAALDCIDSYK